MKGEVISLADLIVPLLATVPANIPLQANERYIGCATVADNPQDNPPADCNVSPTVITVTGLTLGGGTLFASILNTATRTTRTVTQSFSVTLPPTPDITVQVGKTLPSTIPLQANEIFVACGVSPLDPASPLPASCTLSPMTVTVTGLNPGTGFLVVGIRNTVTQTFRTARQSVLVLPAPLYDPIINRVFGL